MPVVQSAEFQISPFAMSGIVERIEHGLIILSPANRRPFRRVLFANTYGGAAVWEKIKRGFMPPHHLWGCLELVRMGYEVALAEPLSDFYLYRNPLPHDLRLLKWVNSWLQPDDIIYCGHNVLYWVPFLKRLGLVRRHVVSLLFAREPLDHASAHSGIIALNPAAAEQARKLAPKVKVAHLGWGVDLNFYPKLPYRPESFLSCGITLRDHRTLCAAAALTPESIRLICPGIPQGLDWTPNVTVIDGGPGWNFEKDAVSYQELLHDHYARASGSLIIIKKDPIEYTAVGFTNLIEAMAMARPVIVTRTGAVPSEIDVEKTGCGLHVPPENPQALAEAINSLASDPGRAEKMGEVGRRLAESHYNIGRYATGLHSFFDSL